MSCFGHKRCNYDNFLNFITFIVEIEDETISETDEDKTTYVIPRLKSGSESSDYGDKTSFSDKFYKYNYGGSYFNKNWEIKLDMTVHGICVGGKKSIDNFQPYTFRTWKNGYSADAALSTINYEMGTNGHVHFAWGWCGGNTGIQLSFTGLGFTISGGGGSGTGESGEKYVRPNDLK